MSLREARLHGYAAGQHRVGDAHFVRDGHHRVSVARALGLREIDAYVTEVLTRVGTVDRTRGFDRSFRPTSSTARGRWERIANMVRRGEPLPPVQLYRIGDVHFVRDGHHRVSVARALGRTEIDAYVTEVLTRVGAKRSLRASDLPLKSNERLFRERVPLPPEDAAQVRLSDPARYPLLAEGVEAWGFRVMQDRTQFLDRRAVARTWFGEEFRPVVALLREADLLGTSGTEADAYLRMAEERYRLLRTHEWSEDVIRRLAREL